MDVRAILFRLRSLIILALYLVGFLAPWQKVLSGIPTGTFWLAAATLLARTGWMNMSASTMGVTLAALFCCVLGTTLRVWGASYLGSGTVHGFFLQGDSLVAAGPYHYLRNPLYLGNWIFALGASILMPAAGAVFFLIALFLFQWVLIAGEEHYLSTHLGEEYRQYRLRVPRFALRLSASVPASDTHPQWLRGVVSEIYFVAFSFCFAALAWRYNRWILIKCLLICYGLSLIASAFPAQIKQERGGLTSPD